MEGEEGEEEPKCAQIQRQFPHTKKTKTITELQRQIHDYKEKHNFGKSKVGEEGHSSGDGGRRRALPIFQI